MRHTLSRALAFLIAGAVTVVRGHTTEVLYTGGAAGNCGSGGGITFYACTYHGPTEASNNGGLMIDGVFHKFDSDTGIPIGSLPAGAKTATICPNHGNRHRSCRQATVFGLSGSVALTTSATTIVDAPYCNLHSYPFAVPVATGGGTWVDTDAPAVIIGNIQHQVSICTTPDVTKLPVFSDCSPLTFTQDVAVGTPLTADYTPVTVTATDSAGNAATTTVTVDNRFATCAIQVCKPTASYSGPNPAILSVDPSTCLATVPDLTSNVVAGGANCAVAQMQITQRPPQVFAIGSHTVTFDVFDPSSSDTATTSTGVVVNSVAPTITCPADITHEAGVGCGINMEDLTAKATVTSSCATTLTQDIPAGTFTALGTTTVTITATDNANNQFSSSCTVNVQVVPPKPKIICANDKVVTAGDGCAHSLGDVAAASSVTSHCPVTTTQDITIGSALPLGLHIITVTSTNDFDDGLSASCTLTVDVVPPVPQFTCPADLDVRADDACTYSLGDLTADVSVSTSCPATITQDIPASSLLAEGTNEVVLHATDDFDPAVHGSCTVRVLVTDRSPPTQGSVPDTCQWPPNHKFKCYPLEELMHATDNCSPDALTKEFVSCSSSEDENSVGDGDTEEDCVLFEGQLCVRSERSGTNDGRRYSVTYKVTDLAGNDDVFVYGIEVPKNEEESLDRHCVAGTTKNLGGGKKGGK